MNLTDLLERRSEEAGVESAGNQADATIVGVIRWTDAKLRSYL